METRSSQRASEYLGAAARIILGGVLVWSGITQLGSAASWTRYVPILGAASPTSLTVVIVLSEILTVTGAAIALGVLVRPACLVATAILGATLGVLIASQGVGDLAIRDIALIGLTLAICTGNTDALRLRL